MSAADETLAAAVTEARQEREPDPAGIDPFNAQFVSRDGLGRVRILFPQVTMTREEALTHAAWLVDMAGGGDEFPAYLAAVRGTR